MPGLPDPVQRVVDAGARRGFDVEVVAFDQSTHTAAEAARAVGAQVGQIVKSLVFVSETAGGVHPCLVLASGGNRVDLKLLAGQLAQGKVRRATADEARQLTGFVIGGIPPFGHLRPIPTFMDPALTDHATVWAAAGTANAVFAIPPAVLRSLANAVVVPIAEQAEAQPAPAASTTVVDQ